jgi:hypothetical protein
MRYMALVQVVDEEGREEWQRVEWHPFPRFMPPAVQVLLDRIRSNLSLLQKL